MEHYYALPQNIISDTLIITGDEAKHLTKVLRKEPGSEIFITDGNGNLYKCVIENIDRNGINCKITDKQFNVNEPSLKLTAYISLLKNPARFEFAIEKLTELGVYEIQPIITERVISKEKDKSERWQTIALSAMKQSQRCRLPQVNSPVDYKIAIKNCNDEVKYIAHEKAASNNSLTALSGLTDKDSASIFIGPEGGFTDNEINFAGQFGFRILNLGSRKYRSETAAIVSAVLLLLHQ